MTAAESEEILASQTAYEKAELAFGWKSHSAIKVIGILDTRAVLFAD